VIPLSANEKVYFKDDDGVVWAFKPRTGLLEREWFGMIERTKQAQSVSELEAFDALAAFFDKVLIGWDDAKSRMPAFPSDNRPHLLFTTEERYQVIGFWMKAGILTPEEKKS
jgi:hypothetical protein